MSNARKRIIPIAALWLVAALGVFAAVPVAASIDTGSVAQRSPSITIRAPANCNAGEKLCFEVVCFGGSLNVAVELNEVILPMTKSSTGDTSVTIVCVRVPAGSAGSSLQITAVSSTGAVATATVAVH